MSKRPSHFEPIEALDFAFRLIADGAKSIAPTLIWTMDQGMQIQSHITQLSSVDQALFCWCPKDLDRKRFFDELAQKQSNDCFFSLTLPQATLFFKAKFVEFGNLDFKFGLPAKVFKVQRRKNYRHLLHKDTQAWVEFRDPLFPDTILKRKLFDISAGGLSFLISNQDAPIYPTGLTIDEIRFNIKDRKIVASAEIQHTKLCTGNMKDMGSKVGISFKKITPGDAEFIAAYVFDESRKMFSRFV